MIHKIEKELEGIMDSPFNVYSWGLCNHYGLLPGMRRVRKLEDKVDKEILRSYLRRKEELAKMSSEEL